MKVSSRSLQRLITGAEQYSKGGYIPKGSPVHCIMNIYFTGDMVYVVDEG